MGKTTYTPGDWTTHDQLDGLFGVYGKADNAAHTPLTVAKDLSKYNARLIAAAPNMLMALRQLRNCHTGASWQTQEIQSQAWQKASVAILKATE